MTERTTCGRRKSSDPNLNIVKNGFFPKQEVLSFNVGDEGSEEGGDLFAEFAKLGTFRD
jgi:hypothetical protein